MDQDTLEDGTALPEPAGLKLLRIMTTTLLAVMILGVIVMVTVFVIRFPKPRVILPDAIALPDGVTADAVTLGPDWIAVVSGGEILIYSTRGALKQRVSLQID